HGGYYQALATGIYQRYGLDVTIRQGGPSVNHAQLLAAGKIQFNMGANSYAALNHVQSGVPIVVVGTVFQKDPQVLIAHPGQGVTDLASIRGRKIMIANEARTTYWQWLRVVWGFSDDQIRPYNFNLGPFLADPTAIQEGFVSSEPYSIEQAGVTPVVLLLADYGFDNYNETIEVTRDYMNQNPDIVQRFVTATILGWKSYLHDDPTPGNALIKADNPEMTDALLAYGLKAIKEHGLVDSGDAQTLGIGAMTDARWQDFFEVMSKQGLYPATMDYKKAYTLQFVNKNLGASMRK
ncbi:MAG TPA: ABC transporter substrate-binding protein, partial [Stellaceae bacterium]|nr:ABC transporter substrate-binding protein [Stellaceae bacterium]